MRTAPIFRNGNHQAICLPVDRAYDGVAELEITLSADVITLRGQASGRSFAEHPRVDADFLQERALRLWMMTKKEAV